eukprot:GFUD01010496.1.p1 GENE.GFUD01010496.1~~GFUD01010496.1.p1  ORF type:complete len:497 (-),score=76.23 GFUD01010496.1:281-1771(-)
MKILTIIVLSTNVGIFCATNMHDTPGARAEWHQLRQSGVHDVDHVPSVSASNDQHKRISGRSSPPKYMLDLYAKYAEKGGRKRGYVRSILPCNERGSMSVEFCHRKEDGRLLRAELHMKTRKYRKEGDVNALVEAESGDDSRIMAIGVENKVKAGWKKYDITSIVKEARSQDWKIHLKFQVETYDNGTDVRLVKPRTIIRFSDQPFIVLFSDDETSFDEDFGSENEIKPLTRQKRFVEITADVSNHPNEVYNYYDHDEFNEFDNRVVPIEIKKHKNNRLDLIDSNYEYDDEGDELFLDYERDDMSEHEANNHRFSVAKVEKQDVLPYPKWWDKKKSKKRNRKKKQSKKYKKKNRDNETSPNEKVDRWNSLPKIWKSFGREVGAGQSLAKNPQLLCGLKPLEVHLREVGWGKTVISPVSYQANYCQGSCTFPLSQAENPSNHATVLSILKRKQGKDLPEPCCVPKKMDSLTLLFFDSDGSVVLKTYPQMSVKSCGCR